MAEQSFTPYIVSVLEARSGDIVLHDRNGPLAAALSWLIQKVKEPRWNRQKWHMTPVVPGNFVVDAQWPTLRLKHIDDFDPKTITVWRVMPKPSNERAQKFVKTHVGKPYDPLVYLWTTVRVFWHGFPRIINRWYDCWEVTFDFIDEMGSDFQSDYEYPFITDFLRWVGALK